MFDDSGSKLRSCAGILFALEILGVIIYAIILMASSFIAGLILLIIGGVCAYIGTLTLYAIADAADASYLSSRLSKIERLIQETHQDNSQVRSQENPEHTVPVAQPSLETKVPKEDPKASSIVTCPACGKTQYPQKKCFNCGKDLT